MVTKPYRQALGQWGEKAALDFLTQKGYQIIGKNVRTLYGEIDLVAKEKNTLVFIEVKTRSTGEFGLPEEAITRQKLTHMIHAAQAYLQGNFETEKDWRIDVIAIRKLADGQSPEIIHLENVIT
jgi:putative endonuclease